MKSSSKILHTVTLATMEMAEAYCWLASEKKNREYVPGAKPKWIIHFEKAARQSAEADLSPMEWCRAIFDSYAEICGDETIPFPNQLHGDTAAIMVSDWFVRRGGRTGSLVDDL